MRSPIDEPLGTPEVAMRDGLPHGSAKWQYVNGATRATGAFQHGSLNGMFREFDLDGNQVREIDFENGIPVTEARWNQDGTLAGLWFERAGDSLLVEWYSSGAGKAICEISDGVPDGLYVELHPSGMQSALGNFSDGVRHGDWVWFDETGKQVGTQEFDSSRRGLSHHEMSPDIDWSW